MIRGTLLHELISLPIYWQEVIAAPGLSFPVEKRSFGPHSRQYCLFARPPQPPRAWVIYWHGGGWQFGSPEQFQRTAQAWLEAGYGVVLPSYRRLPWYDYRAIRHDTINALVACRHYWEEKEEDAYPPVILTGMSAGGHLAAITGLDKEISAQAGWQYHQIRGVVACGAVLDFSIMKNNPLIRILAGSPRGEVFRKANPTAQLKSKLAPFLLVHGTKDGMVPYRAATGFQAQYQQLNQRTACELICLPEGSHLDAARWMLYDTPVRRTILQRAGEWLRTDEVRPLPAMEQLG